MVKRDFLLAGALVVALVCIDQLSKFFVRAMVSPATPISIFGPIQLANIGNTGSVFGLFRGSSGLLVLLAIIVIVGILMSYHGLGTIQRGASLLILSGLLGNTVDRVARGLVTDFIYIRPWPAFNLADSFLTVGAVMLAASVVVKKKNK